MHNNVNLFKDKAVSTSRKRILDCVVLNGTTYFGCNSVNMNYLLICNIYYSHYVEETVQKLNNQSSKYELCHILSDHFPHPFLMPHIQSIVSLYVAYSVNMPHIQIKHKIN